ncbi:MAG: lipid A biosynthesis acyltransferase [Chitinophagaceae bacterium]|nr:lipid A biosynthesis acyltransferase [Chitinophagaceae bacterium]
MYYILYPLIYLCSLLPFFILYGISDGVAFLLRRVFRYRYDVVMGNLMIAFPEKTESERAAIAGKFYQYFTDTFIESIKCISISKAELQKRNTGEYELVNELLAKGCNINILGGHQFNWEYGSLLYALHLRIPITAVYMPISNKVVDRIFYNMRTRFGSIFVSAADFKRTVDEVTSRQYILALAADQNPGDPKYAYWIKFFGRPAPFVTGPERGALKNNAAVIFVNFKKVKRGYYHFEPVLLVEDPSGMDEGKLTCLYRDAVEKSIRNDPVNYLWSHRRFKFEWTEEMGKVLG